MYTINTYYIIIPITLPVAIYIDISIFLFYRLYRRPLLPLPLLNIGYPIRKRGISKYILWNAAEVVVKDTIKDTLKETPKAKKSAYKKKTIFSLLVPIDS